MYGGRDGLDSELRNESVVHELELCAVGAGAAGRDVLKLEMPDALRPFAVTCASRSCGPACGRGGTIIP